MSTSPELPAYIGIQTKRKLELAMAAIIPLLPESSEEVFVCTQKKDPQIPSAWLFTKNLAVEIRNPLNEDLIHFDFCHISKAVDWVRLIARKYDFHQFTVDSELELEFTTTAGASANLWGTGAGCEHLLKIYKDRVLTNFVADGNA